MRYLLVPLSRWITQYGSSTVEICSEDEVFSYVMYWIYRQRFISRSRSFRVSTRISTNVFPEENFDGSDDRVTDWKLTEEDFEKFWSRAAIRNKFKTLYFTPCEGTHYFQFRGRYLALTRSSGDSLHAGSSKKDLLLEAQRVCIERDRAKTIIYHQDTMMDNWTRSISRSPRPLSTIVLDQEKKAALLGDLCEYLHPLTKKWYANRGIPYRRGYLLHGPSDTGKTSLCVAIAGTFGLDVYVTSLNSQTLTEDTLATLFACLPEHCVVLLENIDAAGISTRRSSARERPSSTLPARMNVVTVDEKADVAGKTRCNEKDDLGSNNGISLSGLLNVIDGISSSKGRILIMTTNHIEQLDPALLGAGCVDMSIAFENASATTASELFRSTYVPRIEDSPVTQTTEVIKNKLSLSRCDVSEDEIALLAFEFAAQVPPGKFSPAEVQGYSLKHKSTPKEATSNVAGWIEEVIRNTI